MKFPIKFTIKSGETVKIRPPKLSDAPAMLEYINTLSKEQTYISMQGEQFTLKEERAFVRLQRDKIMHHEGVYLGIWHDNTMVGCAQINLGIRTSHHVGLFGITLKDGYRDQGLGTKLIDTILAYGKEHLPALRIVDLRVFANNPKARHLYEKFGFQEYGYLKGGVKHKDLFVDEVFMSKEI